MTEENADLIEVHRHRGIVTALTWSKSGDYLCCASFDGEVNVWDVATWGRRCLFDPSQRPDIDKAQSKVYCFAAAWDQTNEIIAGDAANEFRLWNTSGEQIKSQPPLFASILRPRPVTGGFAFVQGGDGGSRQHIGLLSPNDAGSASVLRDTYPGVSDIDWSKDGSRLAIACDYGVVIACPWDEDEITIRVPALPTRVIWLDERRIAVGSVDGNVRIYSWTPGSALFGRSECQELLEVLEAHDAPIAYLEGPTEAGDFASMDSTAHICVWARNLALRFSIMPQFNPSLALRDEIGGSVAVALHPRLPLAALDVNRVLYRVNLNCYTVSEEEPIEVEASSPVIDRILARAKLTRKFPVRADNAADNWVLADSSVRHDEMASRTKTLRQIAAVTRSLMEKGVEALCILWTKPVDPLLVRLEEIAFAREATSDCSCGVRKELLRLLEIDIGIRDLPQFRLAAGAAYLSIGHLGAKEAEAAFGADAGIRQLLSLLDERLRRRVYAAESLLGDRDPDRVLQLLDEGLTAITWAISEARSKLGSRLTSMIPYTLILKGGGAKGLAHVGALEEIRQYYRCERFVGTSAGAIVAVLLGAGLTNDELRDELFQTNFADLIHEPWWRCCINLMQMGGLHSGLKIQKWLEHVLASKLKSPGLVRLEQLRFHTTIYACQGHDPTVKFDSRSPATKENFATYAVRCSMSIPFYFVPQLKGGLHIFDGGLKHNYPVEDLLGDAPDENFVGLYLGIPISEGTQWGQGMIAALLDSLLEANDTVQLEKHKDRTVIIDTRPIGTLKFRLSDDEKRFLLLAGQVAALTFLGRRGVDLRERNVETLSKELDLQRLRLKEQYARRAVKRRQILWTVLILALGSWAVAHWHLVDQIVRRY
jgi:predicted acylesterase/phospholipase RssA/WD40 repeat protein